MPEGAPLKEAERLLASSGRPRALPPALRSRLEEVLLTRAWADGAVGIGKPLPKSTRRRLQGRLAARRGLRTWGAVGALGAVAAAVASFVALGVPGRPSRPVAAPAQPKPASSVSPFGSPAAKGEPAGRQVLGPRTAPSRLSGRSGPPAGVLSVVPRQGPATGGNWVVVRGKDVGNAGEVYFGQVRAVRVERVSTSEVLALAPAHEPGTVTVSVGMPAARSLAVGYEGRLPVGARDAGKHARASAGGAQALARYTFRG